MTLPHGFGPDRFDEPDKKCGLGKQCYWVNRCTVHEWIYHNEYVCDLIKVIICVLVIVGGGIMIVVIINSHIDAINEPIYRNIEGYNCNQLAEYVADKSKVYSYAEHRYEWLCVNEQIKEFQ